MQYTIKFYKGPAAKENITQIASTMCSQGWQIHKKVDGNVQDYGNAIGWYDIVQPLIGPDNSEKVLTASIDSSSGKLCNNIKKFVDEVNEFLSQGYTLGTPDILTSCCHGTYPIGFTVFIK